MPYIYDSENIFAKILRKEIPCNAVYENDHVLAFHDIAPQTPKHVLVIPKGHYISFDHFAKEASDQEIIAYIRAIGVVCTMLGISLDVGDGYRMIANSGKNGQQEVPHLHVHILAGQPLGAMIT